MKVRSEKECFREPGKDCNRNCEAYSKIEQTLALCRNLISIIRYGAHSFYENEFLFAALASAVSAVIARPVKTRSNYKLVNGQSQAANGKSIAEPVNASRSYSALCRYRSLPKIDLLRIRRCLKQLPLVTFSSGAKPGTIS
jgi:hypothetical protein